MSALNFVARAANVRVYSIAIAMATFYPVGSWAQVSHPDSHAPIGVMGDHIHKHGELMLSYRYMHMSMQGNRQGSSDVSPQEIALRVRNRFANPPMQPPFLRVAPLQMTMDMHMLGAMYAISDRITLMGMTSYIEKEMQHLTFRGPMGANILGRFTTRTNGIGDTSLSGLIKLNSQWHATLGMSFPTGDVERTGRILTPMNTRPSPRLPYPMQLGSGTYDPILGVTYNNHRGQWGWGGQWRSVFRLGENSEDYTLGDEHRLTGWGSYRLNELFSVSVRLEYLERENIEGMDPEIMAPVQTADPDNQGAQLLNASLGLNILLPAKHNRFAIELAAPLHQKLDGPQLKTDWSITAGWQYLF